MFRAGGHADEDVRHEELAVRRVASAPHPLPQQNLSELAKAKVLLANLFYSSADMMDVGYRLTDPMPWRTSTYD